MSSRSVVIYGGGLLGRQILHHLLAYYSDAADVLGFVDDIKTAGAEIDAGMRCLGSFEDAVSSRLLGPTAAAVVFGIGYSSMSARRAALDRVVAAGYDLFDVTHPKAVIEPGADAGAGSIILGGAVLDQQVTLGPACFVDIGVRLGAGTRAGANNYFSSGTSTGSRVTIGDNCFFGMDCTVTTDVRLGSNLFINAKTLVPRDVGDNVKIVELHKSKHLPLS